MTEELNIQWFPGHMAKARRMVQENLNMVDAVCEVVDARIPRSSRNPEIDAITAGKPRLIILNRCDQADPNVSERWAEHFRRSGFAVLKTDAKSGKGTRDFQPAVRELLKDKIAYYNERGQTGRLLRIMILGIPNVGKSSFINRVAGRRAAEASDRPGVTRGKQWINIGGGIEMLDTPGLLWPKFEDKTVGEHLAFTGAVKDDILDVETLGAHLITLLKNRYPDALRERYKIDFTDEENFDLIEKAGKKRGFIVSGGEVDYERMARVLLDEFRAGKLGRMTLEMPE
ncbi:MAG: ribosome biogenesis GTPase YlqF [Oscillospiraceae bacterium]|nr:ribosome biogenesis GTPase YlqF [Oscillospiraceae bacterium]